MTLFKTVTEDPQTNELDISQLNIQDIKSKSESSVTFQDNKLTYNFVDIIPDGSVLTQCNLSLYGTQNGKTILVEAGIPINTANKELTTTYDNVFIQGSIEYENTSSYVNSFIDQKIVEGSNSVVFTNTEVAPSVSNTEELINFLLKEIEALKSRVQILENDN